MTPPPAPWRVVIVTRILPIVLGFDAVLREAGHEPVALLSFIDADGRYGGFDLTPQLREIPSDLDVLMPRRRSSLAPLLASVRPDLVVCMGFPWKIPTDALAVPTLGWLNAHPSLLPHHRGPVPIAWAIRAGDEELGITFHRMDAELDTGPIVAQRSMPFGDYGEPDELYARLGPLTLEALADALERLAAGEEGTPQAPGGEYETFFGEADAYLDFSRPAAEVHRLVWAWRYTVPMRGAHGALAELDGETVRVLASSLEEVEGARRVECADASLWLVRTEPCDSST